MTLTRTPYCTKIRYRITGAPTLDESEMDGSHAPGVGVQPTSIELVYSAPRDGKPASVSASVTGDWMRFGKPDGGQVTTHFPGSPAGWPAWLAEEARLHDPAPPVVRPELRDQIAEAVILLLLDTLPKVIARAAGRDIETPQWLLHYQRVEQDEAAIERVRDAVAFAERVVATSGPGPASAVQTVIDRLRAALDPHQPAVVAAVAGEEPADETQTLAAMFEGLHTLLATSSRDWGTYRVDAWLWAVLCGWDCEQDEHDETCTHGAMEEMQQQHGWDDEAVAKARRYRAVVRAIENRPAVSQPGKGN